MLRSVFMAALALSIVPVSVCAQTKDMLNADLITVSGRFQFANAKGRLTEARLKLGNVTISPEVSAALGMTEADFKTIYVKALTKSLVNYQHISLDAATQSVVIDVALTPTSYVPGKESSTARFELTVAGQTEDTALKSCLNYTAKSEFKALRRISQNNGQRAIGVFMVVLVPLSAGGFMAAQFMEAHEKDKAFNAGRAVSAYEGVTPDNNAEKTKKFAYVNAIQLVNINIIQYLGQADTCAVPIVAQTSAQEAPALPSDMPSPAPLPETTVPASPLQTPAASTGAPKT